MEWNAIGFTYNLLLLNRLTNLPHYAKDNKNVYQVKTLIINTFNVSAC